MFDAKRKINLIREIIQVKDDALLAALERIIYTGKQHPEKASVEKQNMAVVQKRVTIKTMRQKLHKFIEVLDEKGVRALYVLFEDEIATHFTKVEIKPLKKRPAKRL